MRHLLLLLLSAAAASPLSTAASSAAVRPPLQLPLHDPVSAVQGLISRVLGPGYVAAFTLSVIPPDAATSNDVFTLAPGPGGSGVAISGSSGVALASGLGWYLKYTCNASWAWGVNNSGHQMASVPLPAALPVPATPGRFVSPARYRYSFNTCTFGYSFAWYDTKRWQEEVDRLALWGINAPLLPIGMEAAETAVYSSMGLTEAELQAWFTGHSHLPWQRMANIKAIAGPLPAASVAQQAELGAAVSAMMTAFGMNPVLSGFAGHVPDALRRVRPSANISTSSDWGGVGCTFSCDALLEPTDPLFATLGAALNAKELELFGAGITQPMFNADTFNEEGPESGEDNYLKAWNQQIYGAMTAVSPNAVFVIQAWAFHSSFWTPERLKAYLSPVPKQSILILDLNSEDGPVWQNFDGFWGADW
jgi:alpha-N-acetylglucosaminidase